MQNPTQAQPFSTGNLLAEIFARLNQSYFEGRLGAAIRWGKRSGPRRRSIQLGVYFSETRTIRIHPALAQAWVPREVLESVVFHEMCHAWIPSQRGKGGRRRHHSAEFRQKERSFTHHRWAETWIKQNIRKLLKST